MDSIPMVAITGQVPRPAIGRDAFQETDITGITLPITKHNMLVMEVDDIRPGYQGSLLHCPVGRPGPVLLDIPKDVLAGDRRPFVWPETVNLQGYEPPGEADEIQLSQAVGTDKPGRAPVIMAGHGILISHAFAELRDWLRRPRFR